MGIGQDGLGEKVRKKSRMIAMEVDGGIGKRKERARLKRKKEENIVNDYGEMMEERGHNDRMVVRGDNGGGQVVVNDGLDLGLDV